MSDPEKDPVVHSSLSKPLFIWSAVLVLSMIWGLYDEVYGIRPWKGYQAKFEKLYSQYIKDLQTPESQHEAQIKASPQYKEMDAALKAEEAQALPLAQKNTDQVNQLTPKVQALNDPFQEVRSHVGALTYQIEVGSPSSKESLRKQIGELKAETHKEKLPDGEKMMTFDQMDQMLKDLKSQKAELLQKNVVILAKANGLRKQRDQYLSDRISDASTTTLDSVSTSLSKFDVHIRQIHIKDIDLVDRCESCHLGTREPVTLTAAAMGGNAVFASHPDKELLKIHDPENFGCSPCHGGNGVALSSVEKAHGYNKYWLWPMHHKENIEAGCQQCHVKEVVTEMADTLNAGREIFRLRGCTGCHRYEGFDRETDEIASVNQQIHQDDQQKAEWAREIGFTETKANNPKTSNADAKKLFDHANDLRVRSSGLDAKIEQLDMRSTSLVREVKKVGPSLKEARMKLRKEWIPEWLKDPHKWREGTKMPTFRLDDADRKAIAAFIWNAGLPGQLPQQKTGDPVKGQEAFETRGCMACHSMGEGGQKQGGTFAANLSREGEKANYDYIVRWVHNPRQRTAPYCAYEKRDLTEDDYKKHNLPYEFDLDHDKCPNDGHILQVQQMTPMPSLRLTEDEARDIASYLMTRKHNNATFEDASFMDNPSRDMLNLGRDKVRFYGCAGCHEIAGLEDEQRIGTELTKEGSKPIERLDFALLGHKAEDEGWLTHKGFFEHKLENPAVYDQGKEKAAQDRLKMPNFNFSKPEIDAVTTLLEGSVDASDACALLLQPDRSAAGYHRWLVGRAQVQLHGLPQGACRADECFRFHAAIRGSGLGGAEAAFADRRGRARQSRVADALPQQSVVERYRHQSRWRPAVPARAHAHLQLLGRRIAQAGAILRGSLFAGRAVHSGEGRAGHRAGAHHGAAVVHQRGRALPEVPHDGRSDARRQSYRAEFHRRQGTFAARMGEAVDSRPGAHESQDGDAVRPVPQGRRSLGFRRSHAGELQWLHQGPRRSVGPLYVLTHTR